MNFASLSLLLFFFFITSSFKPSQVIKSFLGQILLDVCLSFIVVEFYDFDYHYANSEPFFSSSMCFFLYVDIFSFSNHKHILLRTVFCTSKSHINVCFPLLLLLIGLTSLLCYLQFSFQDSN